MWPSQVFVAGRDEDSENTPQNDGEPQANDTDSDNHSTLTTATRKQSEDHADKHSLATRFRKRALPEIIRENILAKVLVLFVVVLCVNIVIAGFFFGEISDTLDREVDRKLTATTSLHASAYDNWFTNRQSELSQIETRREFAGTGTDEISRILREERINSEHINQLHYVAVTSGTIVASSDETAVGKQLGAGEINTDILNQQQFVIPQRYTTVSGADTIGLGQRVAFTNFVLIAQIETASIELDPTPIVSGTTTSVVSPNGSLIGNGPPQELTKQSAATPTINSSGDQIIGYQALSAVDGLFVVTRTPTETAFSLERAVSLSFILSVALTFVVLLGVTLAGSQSILGELQELAQRATRIGRGELDTALQTSRRDEIGVLTVQLDEMRDRLKQRISEIEQLNYQLQVTDRLLRHNLHNEMNIVLLRADMIKEGISESVADDAEEILTKCEGLLAKAEKQREITDVLSVEIQKQTIDTVPMLETIVESLRMTYPKAEIAIDGPPHGTVHASGKLPSAFEELLENAIVHNDQETPVVEITIQETGSHLEITVADNGPGLPEIEQQILTGQTGFDQERTGERDEIGQLSHGGGVGLWLVYWVITQSDGQLRYEENEPRGSVVTVALPLLGHEN